MEFKIFTNALKAYETEKGDLYVSGTTSSTIRDLHGDEMSMDALKEMQRTAEDNMTVFLNHNYNVPEDLFGSVTASRIVKRFDSATGQEVYDLDIDVRVVGEDENPEAMRAFRAIKRGVKLGLSIGARVEKASRKMNKDNGEESILIEKIRLMEASVVGIPANQRSYLSSAIKSIKSSGVDLSLLEVDQIDTKGGNYRVGDMVRWGSSGGDATGKITKIVRDGKLEVPGSSFVINGTPDDPAALIQVYRDGKPTETLVGHKMSTLRSAKGASDVIDSVKAVEVEGQPSADKSPLIGALYNLLSEATAFYLKAHGAHWNVVGEEFAQYHKLFGDIYEDVHESLDPIAESLRKLNSSAPFEIKDLARMTSNGVSVEDYEAEGLATALYAANEALLEHIMVAFKAATDANQQGIANFLAERQDMHQKWSWQLRASLAEEEEDAGEGELDTEDTETETEKAAGGKIGLGDFVSFKQVEGADGVGEVEQVLRSGSVMVPKSNEEIPATKSDPAVLIRIWDQSGDKWKPSNEFLGFKASQLKKIKGPGEGAEGKPTATTVPGLEIVQPGGKPKEQEKSMDIEKKTRVTVTVSTDGEEKQPAVAAPAEIAEDAAVVEGKDEVKASAAPDGNEPEDEDVEVVEDDLEEPVVESERARAIEALEALGAKLVDAEGDDLKSIFDALTSLTKSEGDESSVQPETAEAEVVAEVAEPAAEAEVVVEAVPASLEEVESIAKSALDAASAAQEEVTALAAKVTELAEAKAKVEGELSKALELIERISALGVGRKSADAAKVLVRAPEAAPWLNPYVQRALEAQDEE